MASAIFCHMETLPLLRTISAHSMPGWTGLWSKFFHWNTAYYVVQLFSEFASLSFYTLHKKQKKLQSDNQSKFNDGVFHQWTDLKPCFVVDSFLCKAIVGYFRTQRTRLSDGREPSEVALLSQTAWFDWQFSLVMQSICEGNVWGRYSTCPVCLESYL